jgi:hypothetical protein
MAVSSCPNCGADVAVGQAMCRGCGFGEASANLQQPDSNRSQPPRARGRSSRSQSPPTRRRSRLRRVLILVGAAFAALVIIANIIEAARYSNDPQYRAGVQAAQTVTAATEIVETQVSVGQAVTVTEVTQGQLDAASTQAAQAAQPTKAAIAPTSTPVPGLPTTRALDEWEITVARAENRNPLGRGSPSGKYWLIFLQAHNMRNASRSLWDSLDFELVDSRGAKYDYSSDPSLVLFSTDGRDDLTRVIAPRGSTDTTLLFDVAADASPKTLSFYSKDFVLDVAFRKEISFDLSNAP